MSLWSAYQKTPAYVAVPLAILSAGAAIGVTAMGIIVVDFLLKEFDRPFDGPGAGILVILVGVNVAVSAFIAMVSVLINLHHSTSWRTPTIAFGFCVVLLWAIEPFSIRFAPFMLGIGALTCLASCWLLRRKGTASSGHVIEA